MNRRTFFVSKSDENKLIFIENYLNEYSASNIFIICEDNKKHLYSNINAFIVGFKDLNKSENWIRFVNDINKNTLLIVDNVVKFMFFGDGKKKYIKELSQSINYKIMFDVVPFFTEPYEMFYPFWFLGKEILGYNNLQSFKSNHFEEKNSGDIGRAHDFDVIYEKVKDYYIQDYDCFFNERRIVNWSMSDDEIETYNHKKGTALDEYDNPIKIITVFSDYTNLCESKINKLDEIFKSGDAVVLNYMPYHKKINRHLNRKLTYLSFHQLDLKAFSEYNRIIFYEPPIVKPHNAFYIEPNIKGEIIQFLQDENGIENNLYNRAYKIDLRYEFDKKFGNKTNRQ